MLLNSQYVCCLFTLYWEATWWFQTIGSKIGDRGKRLRAWDKGKAQNWFTSLLLHCTLKTLMIFTAVKSILNFPAPFWTEDGFLENFGGKIQKWNFPSSFVLYTMNCCKLIWFSHLGVSGNGAALFNSLYGFANGCENGLRPPNHPPPAFGLPPHMSLFYWPYPSPPISPNSFYGLHQQPTMVSINKNHFPKKYGLLYRFYNHLCGHYRCRRKMGILWAQRPRMAL